MHHPHLEFIGCDLTENLLEIAQKTGKDVFQASATHIPFRENSVNHTICIAVLHHLQSHTERMKLLRELLRITEKGGKLLVTVWALEQPLKPRWRQLTEDGDFIIPWQDPQGNTFERFYHFFSESEINSVIRELSEEIASYSVKIERYNYCLTLEKL
jgi:alkylated DNA repair protein alkB family protein 8